MVVEKIFIELLFIVLVESLVIGKNENDIVQVKNEKVVTNITNVFDGVYTECLLHLSYSCLQKKTLFYLIELNKLNEVPLLGNYVKFVKLNTTDSDNTHQPNESDDDENSEELSLMIDKAVDLFFNSHVMKFSAIGRNLTFPNTEEFVGRKKRKGGGGDSGGGHEDFFKKKIMMMGMMCMKMKFMMMMPAMMGMMGMMSFKGMMFSMMSFLISKIMLLMKLLEKKGFGGGGGGDSGWAASGGGGGAWMPAGGQDYGGGGGGYDANGQWQSRSILEKDADKIEQKPIISYIVPTLSYNNKLVPTHKNYIVDKDSDTNKVKSRKKRGIMDVLQNVYLYWIKNIIGSGIKRRLNYPRYKVINGVKYVYYPNKKVQKLKSPILLTSNSIVKNNEDFKPIIIADDFNRGETVEGGIESRMNRKKFNKMKDAFNDAIDDNPWE